MSPNALATDLGIVAAQAALLYLVSQRLLLGFVVGAVAARGWGRLGRVVVGFLRLPGNLLHELSHAAGYLVTGYTIGRVATCVADREGRGYCEPGRPWSPVHWLPLASAFAAVLPLFVGAMAMRQLGAWLAVPLPTADVVGDGVSSAVSDTLTRLPAFLVALNWASWKTYLFWYLALSIGAELAPSEVDLRKGGPLILLGMGLLVLALYAMPHMEMRPATATAIYRGLRWSLSTVSTALSAGLIGCGLVGAAAGVVVWMLGGNGK